MTSNYDFSLWAPAMLHRAWTIINNAEVSHHLTGVRPDSWEKAFDQWNADYRAWVEGKGRSDDQ